MTCRCSKPMPRVKPVVNGESAEAAEAVEAAASGDNVLANGNGFPVRPATPTDAATLLTLMGQDIQTMAVSAGSPLHPSAGGGGSRELHSFDSSPFASQTLPNFPSPTPELLSHFEDGAVNLLNDVEDVPAAAAAAAVVEEDHVGVAA